MTQNKIRSILALLYVISNFILIILVIILKLATPYMDAAMFKTTLAVLLPTFAGYTTLILTFLIKFQSRINLGTAKVNAVFSFLSIFISTVLIFLSFFVVIYQYYRSDTIENYAMYLTAIQSLVAVHTSLILKSIFESGTIDENKEQEKEDDKH